MVQVMYIAAGGAAGAVLRYWASTGVYAMLGRDFPYGTLAVNVAGSLLIGVLTVMLLERMDVDPQWRAALLIGLLGAFTTFSTFSLETFYLLEQGELAKALSNVLLSVVLCLVATWLGILTGRQL